NSQEQVTLTTSEAATIYYTTDGSTPTEASTAYSAPFSIASGAFVKFFAVDRIGNKERVKVYGPPVQQVQLQLASMTGTTAIFTANAVGGSGSYEYMFDVRDTHGNWSLVQFYGTANTWTWNKSNVLAGSYTVRVWARNLGTTVGYDVAAAVDLVVAPEAAPILANPGDQVNDDSVRSYRDAVLGDTPVSYWRLEEASGVVVAADSAGVNPGSRSDGVTRAQPGALADGSAAAQFNGATAYVRVPNSAAVQLAGDLTIELWLNVSLAARQTLISKGYLHEFELTLETDGRLNLYQGDGSTYQ